jgi:hypothetical protein
MYTERPTELVLLAEVGICSFSPHFRDVADIRMNSERMDFKKL